MALYRTLGELRSEIQTRCGFAGAGASAGVNAPIIDSFLFNAQVQLYYQFDFRRLRYRHDQVMGVGQTLYNYPTVAAGAPADANEERILKVEVNISPVGGTPLWQDIREGITSAHRSTLLNGMPQRYERFSQIEIMPGADMAYTLRIWYIRTLGRFTQDADRATVDDNLVFLHALTNAKLHYKQADGQVYGDQLSSLLGKIKSKDWGNQRYLPPGDPENSPYLVPPRVV